MQKDRKSLRLIAVAARLLLKDLFRRRITLLLLFLVPALFDAVVIATTAHRNVLVVIGSLVSSDDLATGSRMLDERTLSLVFLGAAAVSFLTCFLGFNLVHKRREVDARLVLAGYRVREVLGAKLVVLLFLVLVLAAYETLAIRPWVEPRHLEGVALGLFSAGLVYGCLGFLVGSLVKQELEGIFVIVFLTNVDVGWLQNPIYYATSMRRWLIRSLPGYHPAQLAVVGAFTDERAAGSAIWSLAWSAVTLVTALIALSLRIGRAPNELDETSRTRRYYAKILFVSYVAWVVCFQAVGRYAQTLHGVDLTTAWDGAIPLVPASVWAYEACYVFPFLPLVILEDWHRFNIALVAIIIANVTAFVVYIALPVSFPRPTLGSSLSERVLAFEYAMDFWPRANMLPSMHVAMSWIMAAAMWRRKRPVVNALLLALVGAITISTLLVKQHILLDVITGLAWGFGAFWLATNIYWKVVDRDLAPRDALRRLFEVRRWPRIIMRAPKRAAQ